MNKLKITVVSEKNVTVNKGLCGRNNIEFCGARTCTGGKRAN